MGTFVKLLFSLLMVSRLALANFGDDLENIAYLSAQVLGVASDENRTVVPFPLYQLIVLMYETASDEVKAEITQFFPKAIDSEKTAQLASTLKVAPGGKTELYSHLYLFLNQNKVSQTALDTMSEIVPQHFIKQSKFSPDKKSIEVLNQQISLDHNGKLIGTLKDNSPYNTTAFLVATLYINTPWKNTFKESVMIFNNQSPKKSFLGNTHIKYYKDDTKIVIHIPTHDNFYFAIKMHHDGSVATINADDISADTENKFVILELPEFTIENSINVMERLKDLLPLTFSPLGFKTFLLSDQENINVEEFKQTNKLEVTLSGIKAESFAVMKMVTRSGGSAPTGSIQINRPFSFLLYKETDGIRLPLLNGEVWDPQSLTPSSPSLNMIPQPVDSTSLSFFKLLGIAFEGRRGKTVWGTEDCVICPLSILIALESEGKIYNNHHDIEKFLHERGCEITLDNYAYNLMRNDIVSVSAIESIRALINGINFDEVIIRLMGLNDDIKTSLQWFLEDSVNINLSEIQKLIPIHRKNCEVVFNLTLDEWKKIKSLDVKVLSDHLVGLKNESLTAFSYKLLKEDDANFLYFLKRLLSEGLVDISDGQITIVPEISTPEKLQKVIESAYFIIKNKNLLRSLDNEQKIRILGLTNEQAEKISKETFDNMAFSKNALSASPANVLLTRVEASNSGILSCQTITIGLRWRDALDANKAGLLSGATRGMYSKTQQATTVAIPAYGDLFFIVEIHHNPDDYMSKPLVSYEGGQELQFFISLPNITIPPSSTIVPFSDNFMEIQSNISISQQNLPGAPKLDDYDTEIVIPQPDQFSYAITRKVRAQDGSISYPILVTGVHKQ